MKRKTMFQTFIKRIILSLILTAFFQSIHSQEYPDLIITNIEWENISAFSGNPDSLIVGDTIVFKAWVKNQGEYASPDGIIHGVAFKVNGASIGWTDSSRNTIIPGDSLLLSIMAGGEFGNGKWVAKAPGDLEIFAYVDDACGGACGENRPECKRICETDENNNTFTATFTVYGETPVIPKMPDLAIVDLDFILPLEDQKIANEAEDVIFKAQIKNIGDKTAVSSNGEIRTTFLINNIESGSRISRTIGGQIFDSLAPGETIEVIGNFGEGSNKGSVAGSWLAHEGDTVIIAQIDRENKVEEANENNNLFHKKLYSGVDINTLKPDIICTNIIFEPEKPIIIGDTVTLTAVIKNNGYTGVPANTDSRVKFRHNGALISRTHASQAINDSIPPDSTVVVSGSIQSNGPEGKWIPPEPGEYIIQAESDAQAHIDEDIENNNNFYKRLVVHDLSDLIISDIGWTGDIDTVEALIPVQFTATIKNKSGAPLMVGDTIITKWRALDSFIGLDTLVLSHTLEVDSCVITEMNNTWIPASGEVVVQAEVNMDEKVKEKYFDNNIYQENILVKNYSGPLPDLIVNDIIFDPPEPMEGDTINLSAVIENVGEVATFEGLEHRVYFHVDGIQVGWTVGEAIFTGSIEPYETITLTQNFVFQGRYFVGKGDKTYTAMAYVDKTEKIDESDENNNTFEKDITVPSRPGFDLVISGLSIDPASPVAKETVKVLLNIENQGTLSSPDGQTISIQIFINGTEIGTINHTDPINAGQSAELALDEEWQAEIGDHVIQAIISISGEESETNVDNNTNELSISVSDPDNITKNDVNKQFYCFPNPARNHLYIRFNAKNQEKALLSVVSITGREIITNAIQLKQGNNIISLKTSSLEKGTYIILMKGNSCLEKEKIFILK